MEAFIVTYFGNSTVCTIAGCVTLVLHVRHFKELTVGHLSSSTESELFVSSVNVHTLTKSLTLSATKQISDWIDLAALCSVLIDTLLFSTTSTRLYVCM